MKTRPQPELQSHAEFFVVEQAVWRELSATWRGLSEEAFTCPGACGPGRSIKDVLNHLAAWQEIAVSRIEGLLTGRFARGVNTQAFNAQQFAQDQSRSLVASRHRLNRARRALLARLATVPEKQLLYPYGRQSIGWWAKSTTYGHYQEHLAALRAFRAGFPSQ